MHSYQFNPHLNRDETITNILVKALTVFPNPDFSLALSLLPTHVLAPLSTSSHSPAAGDAPLSEAVQKLNVLKNLLEGADYAAFWSELDSDDLYADLVADVSGFEELMRVRIAATVSQAIREVDRSILEGWLNLNGKEFEHFVGTVCGWNVDGDKIKIPINKDNEAKGTVVRENVKFDRKPNPSAPFGASLTVRRIFESDQAGIRTTSIVERCGTCDDGSIAGMDWTNGVWAGEYQQWRDALYMPMMLGIIEMFPRGHKHPKCDNDLNRCSLSSHVCSGILLKRSFRGIWARIRSCHSDSPGPRTFHRPSDPPSRPIRTRTNARPRLDWLAARRHRELSVMSLSVMPSTSPLPSLLLLPSPTVPSSRRAYSSIEWASHSWNAALRGSFLDTSHSCA